MPAPNMSKVRFQTLNAWAFALLLFCRIAAPALLLAQAQALPTANPRVFLDTYCITCHNQKLRTAGLTLDTLDVTRLGANAEVWERVIAKLRAGSMPPQGMPRADAATYRAIAITLENEIDHAWAASPNPGRIGAVQRLNRGEYNNAIRDLFALDLDVKPLLPGDDTADGSFDNFADILSISTAHLERYMSVARQVTRLATGLPPAKPNMETFEIPLHVMQDDRQSEDLPFGSRGGMAIHYDFPVDGEYLIKVRLQRQYQDYLKGMGWPQKLDIRLDGKLLKRFTVGGAGKGRPAASSYAGDGEPGFAGRSRMGNLHAAHRRCRAGGSRSGPGGSAGGGRIVREGTVGTGRPAATRATRQSDRQRPGVHGICERGFGPDRRALRGSRSREQPAKDTPSRRAIFVCQPPLPEKPRAEERACAATILSRMARLAYRRPSTKADVDTLLQFFDSGRQDGGSFDSGIQFALERMLVDPDFLLRVVRDPAKPKSAAAYRLSDLGIGFAPVVFPVEQHPRRSLADAGRTRRTLQLRRVWKRKSGACWPTRAPPSALVNDFAAQWLNLRRVEEVVVDPLKYPNYDESLLQAFQAETEMFVASTLREDRSVDDLLNADYTFVNERLARHYGIPGVYGSRFRKREAPRPRSARRSAGAGSAAGDHVLPRPHIAGPARQMAAEQYLWVAHTASSSGSEHHPG